MKRVFVWMAAAALVWAAQTAAEEAQMLRGLDALPHLTLEETSLLPEAEGRVVLTLEDGTPLPYDERSNTYFLPQDPYRADFDGVVVAAQEAHMRYMLSVPDDFDKQTALSYSRGFEIYGISEDGCVMSDVILTNLPVITIENDSGSLPGDGKEMGSLALYEAVNGEIMCTRSRIEINLRGNTSKRLPKKSYRVNMIEEDGSKGELSFPGLRSDDDWILNPLYADTSKIREKLAYELWAQFNSCGEKANSSRLEYAEVFFDGQYWGLYGVQERIDRKQVNADKRTGILYKVFANDRPTVGQLLECGEQERCGGLEIKHAGKWVKSQWTPAASYMSLLFGEDNVAGAAMSIENTIDYGLWAMLMQAHDCHFKNQFLHAAYEDGGYRMYKIPWDLNHTFGDVWYGDGKDQNYTNYHVGSLVMDGSFEKLLEIGSDEVYGMVRDRWAELRATCAREEVIMERAQEIHSGIYAAIVRDAKRWPQCGMGDGNADNIRDIATSLRVILPRIDAFAASLGSGGESGQ